jgi:hypothetical protein
MEVTTTKADELRIELSELLRRSSLLNLSPVPTVIVPYQPYLSCWCTKAPASSPGLALITFILQNDRKEQSRRADSNR